MPSSPRGSVTVKAGTRIPAPAHRRLVTAITVVALALAALLVPSGTTAASAATTLPSAATASTWAHNMLTLLNAERRANGLTPLRMNAKLTLSAHRHNATMARTNTMSHQLPGEAFFATRITRAGYTWRAAGENIGWNSALTNSGLQALEKQMYQEKAPENGHRLNILSHTFRDVGIDVYIDAAHHKMWFTQDFGRAA